MAQVATPDEILERGRKSNRWIAILERFGVLLFFLVLILFFTSQNERFLSVRNIFNILADVSVYGIMAVGMTFVILTADVDLRSAPCWPFVRCAARRPSKGQASPAMRHPIPMHSAATVGWWRF